MKIVVIKSKCEIRKYELFLAEESYSMISSAVLRAKHIEQEGVDIPVQGLMIKEKLSKETEILAVDLKVINRRGRERGSERGIKEEEKQKGRE